MTIDTQEPLVRAKIRKWHDIPSGLLVVTRTQLTVYRQKLVGGLEERGSFETASLKGVEPDTSKNAVRVTLNGHPGDVRTETFSFIDRRQGETVSTVLAILLKEADEERKRQEEEAARLKREQEEHEQRVREAFASDVWEIAGTIGSLTRANYSMVHGVIRGDWSEARQQYSTVWQQTDRLKNSHQINLLPVLQELDEKMRSENGEEAIKTAASLLTNLSDQLLRTEAFWGKWQNQSDALPSISPNWDHVPYFLLYSVGHFETVLSSQVEDWTGVSNGLALLRSTSPVLHACFDIDVDELLDAAMAAAESRNSALLAEAMKCVESAIAASSQARRFGLSQVTQPDGEHNGTLPEQA